MGNKSKTKSITIKVKKVTFPKTAAYGNLVGKKISVTPGTMHYYYRVGDKIIPILKQDCKRIKEDEG